MCKNCFDCKHKNVTFEETSNKITLKEFEKISENEDSSLGAMYGNCIKGYTSKLVKHYKENGNLKKDECKVEMDCFEKTDFAKATDSLIETINKLLEK